MELLIVDTPLMALIAGIAGIILLVFGGNWTIDSSVYVARRWGISPLVVGFTILAFGTSLPELVVSVLANFEGSSGIALGNVIGSNIANILMVIGLTAIFVTLKTTSKMIVRDLVMMLACTIILVLALLYGEIGRIIGAAMLLLLLSYVFMQYRMAKSGKILQEEEDSESEFSSQKSAYGFLLLGLIAIALGAEFLVRGAIYSASALGVPEAVIALSVIAFGTSLPELTTCIVAGRKGQSDIALGNIIGSNVFNILMIIGVTALMKPIAQGSFAAQIIDFDIWVALIVSVIFAALIIFTGKVTKPTGIVFFSAYIIYNIYIYAIYIGS